MLMHLFVKFLDEKLPSEDSTDAQPFSSKHFVGPEESISDRATSIQIQHITRQPAYFRLLAGNTFYETYPRTPFHVIILMVEYISLRHHGFLGIANLASPAIDLISILKV